MNAKLPPTTSTMGPAKSTMMRALRLDMKISVTSA